LHYFLIFFKNEIQNVKKKLPSVLFTLPNTSLFLSWIQVARVSMHGRKLYSIDLKNYGMFSITITHHISCKMTGTAFFHTILLVTGKLPLVLILRFPWEF
jgi:hypothetical protein